MRVGSYVLMLGVSPAMRGGIAAVVASLLDGGLGQQVALRYVNTYSERGGVSKALSFFKAFFQVLVALLGGQVALVHAHVASNASFWRKSLLLAMARAFGTPTIFHLHGGGFADFAAAQRRPFVQRWIRHSLEASSVVVVLSPRWALWARSFAPQARVEVMPNPVSIPALRPLGAGDSAVSSDASGTVLYLGLISPAKGSFDLLRSWAAFRCQFPGWRLQLGGNGDVEGWLAEADALGVRADIDYLGWVTAEAKEAAFRRADIFVLPSYKEGMPVAVLEAMAYGVPVVTTPVGGTPDMLDDGVEGLMVQPGDTVALAAALAKLAASTDLRRKQGGAGRRRVEANNAVAVLVKRWLMLYERIWR